MSDISSKRDTEADGEIQLAYWMGRGWRITLRYGNQQGYRQAVVE